MLDRKRYFGDVSGGGAAGARWYQDGHYFAPDGTYLFSNPDVTSGPRGVAVRTILQAKEAAAQAEYARQRKATPRVAPPPPPPPPAAGTTEQAPTLTRAQKLAQLSYFELDPLVRAAGGGEIKGKGAKQRMIDYLLANTSE